MSRFASCIICVAIGLGDGSELALAHGDEAANANTVSLTNNERNGLHQQARDLYAESQKCLQQGNVGDAERNLERVLELLTSVFPVEKYPDGHAEIADTLAMLGALARSQGQSDRAATRFAESLAAHRRLYPVGRYPNGNLKLLNVLNDFGTALQAKEDWQEAEKHLAEALDMALRLFRADKHPNGHPLLARAWQNLGHVRHQRGDYAGAADCCREALAMNERLYPTEAYPDGHAALAYSLFALGTTLLEQGERETARVHFERSLQISRRLYPTKTFPNGNIAIATCLKSLGLINQLDEKHLEAVRSYQEALATFRHFFPESAFPSGQKVIAELLVNLSSAETSSKQYDRAREHCDAAIKIYERLSLGPEYRLGRIEFANALQAMSNLLCAAGDGRAAVPYGERALTMATALFPEDAYPNGHRYVANVLTSLALARQVSGDFVRAEEVFRKALAMTERLYPANEYPNGHVEIARGTMSLGYLMQAKGDCQSAADWFAKALSMFQKLYSSSTFPNGHRDIASAMDFIGGALTQLGQHENGLKYHHKALEMRRRLYPKESFPDGHPEVIESLLKIGGAMQGCDAGAVSLPYFVEALDLAQRLYPADHFPEGHPQLVRAIAGLGTARIWTGEHRAAVASLDQAVQITRRLYPVQSHPDGHPDIADALLRLAWARAFSGDVRAAQNETAEAVAILCHSGAKGDTTAIRMAASSLEAEAQASAALGNHRTAQQELLTALAILRQVYPPSRFPAGNPELADCLSQIGIVHANMSEHAIARRYLDRAIAMRKKFADKFRHGADDPALAHSLIELAGYQVIGAENSQAQESVHRALAIARSIFADPAQKWQLAQWLQVGARASSAAGNYDRAQSDFEEALAILDVLYPEVTYPNGNPDLASCLEGLSIVLAQKGAYDRAEEYCQRALEMRRSLFPRADHPHGHESLAGVLRTCGILKLWRGDYQSARDLLQEAVEIDRALHPGDAYPAGHVHLAACLSDFAVALWLSGDVGAACGKMQEACEMAHDLADAFSVSVSDAEALTFTSGLSAATTSLLSMVSQAPHSDDLLYSDVWRSRGVILRIATVKRRALAAGADTEEAARLSQLNVIRNQLARLTLSPSGMEDAESAQRRSRLRELTGQKERLEREIADAVPEFARQHAIAHRSHGQLAEYLPSNAAFVDLVRYAQIEHDASTPGKDGIRRTASYIAFVLGHARQIEIIRVGPAEPIEAAVRDWREAIRRDKATDAADTLRRLVWEPIEQKLPLGTKTVYFTPDGPLTALPWAALPGKKPGTVLLEDYALALVPYGQLLLDQLTAAPRTDSADDALLAVGGVVYDEQPVLSPDDGGKLAMRGEVGLEGPRVRWPDLPGTHSEVDALAELAGGRTATVLSRSDASTARVLAELPKARWAVFATHGFFADPKFRSALQLDESIFEHREFLFGGERTTPVGRNPLLLSGLVLAGANLPRPNDEFGIPLGDGGILSAEQIAGLPLDKLELAILSACDTGLGEVAGGEGVFGLQRAFHQAGAANVVASLWKIDDHATAALMRLFYYKLFRENKPPLAALREAQLAIYHHPEQIGPLASARAPEFGKTVKLVDGGKSKTSNGRAATRLWAGFVLSGAGR